ncbi:MAG: LamG-like jellyroll fold domain-containing protein [Pirellulaceae bacterium]
MLVDLRKAIGNEPSLTSPEGASPRFSETIDTGTGVADSFAETIDLKQTRHSTAESRLTKGALSPQQVQRLRPGERSTPAWGQRYGKWVLLVLLASSAALIFAVVADYNGGDPPVVSPSSNRSPDTFNALRFNGESSYVWVENISHTPDRPLTVEAIVLTERFRVSNAISWLGPEWTALFISEHNNWGIGRLTPEGSRLIVADQSTPEGVWVHVAGTWDGQQLGLFIDGRAVATHEINFKLPETEPALFIGGFERTRLPSDQDDRFYAGLIGAVRLSEGVLYTESFSLPPASPPTSEPSACFSLTRVMETWLRMNRQTATMA